MQRHPSRFLQLDIIVQQPHLFARLEGWQANVRTSITPKGITQRTVTTTANLALYRKVHLSEIVGVEFKRIQGLVGGGAFGGIFGFESLLHAASAILAGATSLSWLGLALGSCDLLVWRNGTRERCETYAE